MSNDIEFEKLQAELHFINGELVRTAKVVSDDGSPLTEEQKLILMMRGAMQARRSAIMKCAADMLDASGSRSPAGKWEGMFEPLEAFQTRVESEPEPLVLQAVAIACERAYRRGVQHGASAGKVDAQAVFRWRYPRNLRKAGPALAIPFKAGPTTTAAERLELEEPGLVTALVHPVGRAATRALKDYIKRHTAK